MFGDSIVFNLKIPGESKTGHTFYNEDAKESFSAPVELVWCLASAG